VCPVAKKAVFEDRESNQALASLASENFGLGEGAEALVMSLLAFVELCSIRSRKE